MKASPGEEREVPRYGTARSSVNWVTRNLMAESVLRGHDRKRSVRVRYEDVIRNPHRALLSIARLVDESPERLPLLGTRVARLGTNHTAAGNPNRFGGGDVSLRSDDEWISRQGSWDRAISTMLTAPLLMHYGYSLRARQQSDDS